MKTMSQKPKEPPLSLLEKFSIGFEYDVSWVDAKKSVKVRTIKG